MSHKKRVLTGVDGVELFYQAYVYDGAYADMIVVHGLAEHSGRYGFLTDYCEQKRINTYLMDNRGHGESGGRQGHIDSFFQYLDDLGLFVHEIRKSRDRDRDLFILGHSLGANIVAAYLIERDSRFSGAVFSGPAFRLGTPVNPLKWIIARLMSRIAPRIPLDNGVIPENLSHDPKIAAAYRKDPKVFRRVSARLGVEALQSCDFVMNRADRIKCPVLILQGGDDMITSSDGAREFYNRLKSSEKEIHIFDGFYHEVFNEIGKEKVFDAMHYWMQKIIARGHQ